MNLNINTIPFFKADIGKREKEAVLAVLDSGWLTTGPQCTEFEKEFASFCHAECALTVNSGTSGLHLVLDALEIGPGDKVAVPSYTFAATAEVAIYRQAEPVFIDSLEDSPQMDPDDLLKKLSNDPSIKAVIAVHFSGAPCRIEEIDQICRDKGIFLIEDCAHSFPVKHNGRYLGTYGVAGVFSFYATKCITTGEGGMILTNRKDLHKKMKIQRLHGIDKDVWNRYTREAASSSWQYDLVSAGYKYNMTDIQAALGRVQLQRACELKERRKEAVVFYLEQLAAIKEIEIPHLYSQATSYHLFAVAVKESKQKRDALIEYLFNRNIGVSVHFIPLHRMTYYKRMKGQTDRDFPRAAHWGDHMISLPLYPSLTRKQISYICKSIEQFFRETGDNSFGK